MTAFQGMNRVTSPYGYREYYNNGRLVKEIHRGVDLVPTAFSGQSLSESAWQVREVTGGKVLRVTSDASRGKYVDIETAPGVFERYQHMKSICVSAGQTVLQGSVLGVAGNTGNSTGAHLHFGVYRGGRNESNAIDPSPWLGLPNEVGLYTGNDASDAAGESDVPPQEEITSGSTVAVIMGPLRVRTAPGTQYSAVGSVAKGDKLVVLERSGDWGYVKALGGWVCLDYVQAV